MSSAVLGKNTMARSFLRSLSEEGELTALRSIVVKRGDPLVLQSAPGGSLYVLELGRLKILKVEPHGKELILDIVERGDVFGELTLLQDEEGETMAEALEDSRIAVVPWSQVRTLITRRPDLSFELVKLFCARRRRAEQRLASFVFNNVPGRLAALLRELAHRSGVPDARGTLLPLRLTQRDIGRLIGASREMVSLTLAEFRRRGLIEMEGRRLIVKRDLVFVADERG